MTYLVLILIYVLPGIPFRKINFEETTIPEIMTEISNTLDSVVQSNKFMNMSASEHLLLKVRILDSSYTDARRAKEAGNKAKQKEIKSKPIRGLNYGPKLFRKNFVLQLPTEDFPELNGKCLVTR